MKDFLYWLTSAWKSEVFDAPTRLLEAAICFATGWLLAPWLLG